MDLNFGDCDVSTFMLVIRVKCNNMTNGFLIVVKSSALAKKGKIYVEVVESTRNSATIGVKESGEYFVFVIPTLPETGIINSTVEYMENVTVESLQTVGMSS